MTKLWHVAKISISCLALLFSVSAVAAQGPSSAPPPGEVSTPKALPAGHTFRYKIPYYTSEALLATTRSVAIVTIHNDAAVTCNFAVSFQFLTGTTDICVISMNIPPRTGRIFCSRPVGDPLAPCSISCPNGGLTFNTGHAYLTSTNTDACSRMSVDARQFFTRDANDDLIESQSPLTLVKIGGGNIGD